MNTNVIEMEFDVIIVGAGPAGLASAIRLAQLMKEQQCQLQIAVLDKGATIGAHSLSGAVMDVRAINELIPNYSNVLAFTPTEVTDDRFYLLTQSKSIRAPLPPQLQNHGNVIISLGLLCTSLSHYAQSLGIDIFPGFAAVEVLYEDNVVRGVRTGDKGIDRLLQPKAQFSPGMKLYAKKTIFAEGTRGSLTQEVQARFNLGAKTCPQTYGLGFKEVWETAGDKHQKGLVIHSVGWPLNNKSYGGGFMYHYGENLISIGLVSALNYRNPYFNPYEEFQQYKTHPFIQKYLQKGKRIAYGARTVNEGGWQALPQLSFPGGMLIGDCAGLLNVPRIKGIHAAIKSGMLAAESIFAELNGETLDYDKQLRACYIGQELYAARNIRPAFHVGFWGGIIYAAIDTYLFRGKAPWTWTWNTHDRNQLKNAVNCQKIAYPAHDNAFSFDLSSSVYLAHVNYDENQPYHLKLNDKITVPIAVNYNEYAGPETRYCPAGVYEYISLTDGKMRLQINGGNCIHCKACDIKDPTANIKWTPSEGGSGPNYMIM